MSRNSSWERRLYLCASICLAGVTVGLGTAAYCSDAMLSAWEAKVSGVTQARPLLSCLFWELAAPLAMLSCAFCIWGKAAVPPLLLLSGFCCGCCLGAAFRLFSADAAWVLAVRLMLPLLPILLLQGASAMRISHALGKLLHSGGGYKPDLREPKQMMLLCLAVSLCKATASAWLLAS